MDMHELRRIAAREELSLNFVAKDEMMSILLAQLQGIDDIILKGGTAINRVYLNKKRFSEDADFDLIYTGTAKDALSRTQEIIAHLKSFIVEKARIMKQTIRYDLQYTNPLQHKDLLRLEFRVTPAASQYSKRIVNPGFVPADAALLNVYEINQLILHKIECILSRREGKDLFDLYFLLEISSPPISAAQKEKLRQRLSLSVAEIKVIANTLNHYIPKMLRPDWEIFIEELKEKIERA